MDIKLGKNQEEKNFHLEKFELHFIVTFIELLYSTRVPKMSKKRKKYLDMEIRGKSI